MTLTYQAPGLCQALWIGLYQRHTACLSPAQSMLEEAGKGKTIIHTQKVKTKIHSEIFFVSICQMPTYTTPCLVFTVSLQEEKVIPIS